MPFSAKLFPNFTMVAKDTRLRPAEGGPGGGQGEWQPGRGGAQPGGLRTPTRCPRLVSRERWQGRGDRSPSEFPGCVLMGISRLPSRRAPGSAQRGEGGNATRAQPFRTRPQSRRAGLLSVSRGPQRERCSAARPTPHPHSPHAWLRKVWAPSALRGSASPAPACSNGGGGAAAGGSAIGFCASRLRAPPPSCRSRGPRAGVRVGPRRCASALTQRRPRANRPHKGARGCGGGGPPGTPRATRPGEGEPEVPDAELWDTPAGCATLGRWPNTGRSGGSKGREGTGRPAKPASPKGRKRGLLCTAEQI